MRRGETIFDLDHSFQDKLEQGEFHELLATVGVMLIYSNNTQLQILFGVIDTHQFATSFLFSAFNRLFFMCRCPFSFSWLLGGVEMCSLVCPNLFGNLILSAGGEAHFYLWRVQIRS